VFYGFATNGGNQALHKAVPTRQKPTKSSSAHPSVLTPMMCSINGIHPATTTRRQGLSEFRPHYPIAS
jgi:hypothetical protein